MTVPLNGTECTDDDDCSNFPGAVCRVNRILPKTGFLPGSKPTASFTKKRCQCDDDKAEDLSVPFPFGCTAGIYITEAVYSLS